MSMRKDGQGKLGDKGGVVVGGRCHYVTFNAYCFSEGTRWFWRPVKNTGRTGVRERGRDIYRWKEGDVWMRHCWWMPDLMHYFALRNSETVKFGSLTVQWELLQTFLSVCLSLSLSLSLSVSLCLSFSLSLSLSLSPHYNKIPRPASTKPSLSHRPHLSHPPCLFPHLSLGPVFRLFPPREKKLGAGTNEVFGRLWMPR